MICYKNSGFSMFIMPYFVDALACDFRVSAPKKPAYIHLCMSADYGILFRGGKLHPVAFSA